MNLLLDTHVFLAVLEERTDIFPPGIQGLLSGPANAFHISVASLWEIAIKWRLGKLTLSVELDHLPGLITVIGAALIPINAHHVLASVRPEPATRDPFDRLLLAQCQVERLRLVTIDRALVGHKLAAMG